MQMLQPAPDVIHPTPGIPAGGLNRLKEMIERLPKNQRSTAVACWDDGSWDTEPVPGVRDAAWLYAQYRESWAPSVSKATSLFPEMTPHLVAIELRQVARDTRNIIAKLVNLRPDSLNLIHSWLGEDEPWWAPNAKGLLELRDLAQDMEKLAQMAADNRQTSSTIQEGMTVRLVPVERLIYDIGKIVSFRNGKVTHILPLARLVHEWATGEIPGPAWGERPYKNVRPSLKDLNWSRFSDEERAAPPPPPPHDPEAGKRRLERLKASLKAQSEVVVK